MLGYLLGIDTFKRLMKDHGVEFYLGRCPLDPGHKCGGVPGAYGLPSLDCCSNKTKPKWMMVGTYLKNHPLANLLVCADCYPNVLPREHRILQHWIVNDIPDDIPDHVLHRYKFLQLRIDKNRGYTYRSQEPLNGVEFARTRWKQNKWENDKVWRAKHQVKVCRNAQIRRAVAEAAGKKPYCHQPNLSDDTYPKWFKDMLREAFRQFYLQYGSEQILVQDFHKMMVHLLGRERHALQRYGYTVHTETQPVTEEIKLIPLDKEKWTVMSEFSDITGVYGRRRIKAQLTAEELRAAERRKARMTLGRLRDSIVNAIPAHVERYALIERYDNTIEPYCEEMLNTMQAVAQELINRLRQPAVDIETIEEVFDVVVEYEWPVHYPSQDTPLLYKDGLPRVSNKVYLEILPTRMQLVVEGIAYRFPQFYNVQDATLKGMNECLVEAMDVVFNNPEDWKERDYYVQQSINAVQENRERGRKAAETARVNKQKAIDCGLPKTEEFDVVPFDLEAFPTAVIADRCDNNVQPYCEGMLSAIEVDNSDVQRPKEEAVLRQLQGEETLSEPENVEVDMVSFEVEM